MFDVDLSPEGITETFTAWDQPSGLLRTVKVTAVQWTIKEFGSKNATDLFDDTDAWMFGGQVQAEFVPTSDIRLTLAIADYSFKRLNAIARERNSNSALQVTNSSNNSPPLLMVTMTPFGDMAPQSKGTCILQKYIEFLH